MGAAVSSLIQVKGQARSDLSPEQRTFAKLQKKIESLQKKERVLTHDLDSALQLYYAHIRPIEVALAHLSVERAQIAYQFYKEKRIKISQPEQELLKELILADVNEIFHALPLSDVPEDVRRMFKELEGMEYEDLATEELGHMKSDLEGMFKGMGVDIDLSGIDVNDSQEEMVHKLFGSLGAAAEKDMDRIQIEKKSKKQKKRELRQSQIEELQNKSLNSIFRQLAKALHPDLEPDSEKRGEKAELMKQVTAAYEKEDLHALLALELTWIKGLDDASGLRSLEQLRIYNGILRDQVEALKARIEFLWGAPRYFPLQKFYPHSFQGSWVLHKEQRELQMKERDFRQFVEKLRTPAAESMIRQAIREMAAMQMDDDSMEDVFDRVMRRA